MKRVYYDNGDLMSIAHGFDQPADQSKKLGSRIIGALALLSFIFMIFAAAIVTHIFFFTD